MNSSFLLSNSIQLVVKKKKKKKSHHCNIYNKYSLYTNQTQEKYKLVNKIVHIFNKKNIDLFHIWKPAKRYIYRIKEGSQKGSTKPFFEFCTQSII